MFAAFDILNRMWHGPAKQSIDYQSVPPARSVRHPWRWALAGALVILAVTAPWWMPALQRRGQMMYWQYACLHHQPRGDAVFDSKRSPPGRAAPEWARFYQAFNSSGINSTGTVFLHRLQNPAGQERLVAVDLIHYQLQQYHPSVNWGLSAHVIVPSNLGLPAIIAKSSATAFTQFAAGSLRFDEGVVDPADPTHFTINGQHNGRAFHLDGWLLDDDSVLLRPTGTLR